MVKGALTEIFPEQGFALYVQNYFSPKSDSRYSCPPQSFGHFDYSFEAEDWLVKNSFQKHPEYDVCGDFSRMWVFDGTADGTVFVFGNGGEWLKLGVKVIYHPDVPTLREG
jgi:hypothetical protein